MLVPTTSQYKFREGAFVCFSIKAWDISGLPIMEERNIKCDSSNGRNVGDNWFAHNGATRLEMRKTQMREIL